VSDEETTPVSPAPTEPSSEPASDPGTEPVAEPAPEAPADPSSAPASEPTPEPGSTPLTIDTIQLSFVWTETLLGLFRAGAGSLPLAAFRSKINFAPEYDTIAASSEPAGPLKLRVPWERPTGQLFWTYYLEGQRPGDIDGDTAWSALVPLRSQVDLSSVTAPWFNGRMRGEAYYHPFGVALVLTFRSSDAWTLEQAVEHAMTIARSGRYDVADSTGATTPRSLSALADQLLVQIREAGWGAGARPDARSRTPFTVFTVISGTGASSTTDLSTAPEIHRTLQAVTRWSGTWKDDQPAPLDTAVIPTKNAPVGHVLFGHARGRAVWFPGSFVQEAGSTHSLACYHRNLTLLSMQIESLSGLIRETADQLRANQILADHLSACAGNAALMLARLYTGDTATTYRSGSAKRQLEESGVIDDLNLVIQRLNIPEPPITVGE